MAKLSKGMVGLLGEIVSLLHGAVASGLRLVNNLVSSGFKMAFQYNETAMAFSRQAGLTAKQAQAYTEVLTKRARDLGEKYGIAAEEVAKLEQNLAKATGRVLMLNRAEAESLIQINRTVGEQTFNDFSQTMMRTMGGQFQTVQGAVSKAYATAAKSGLDAAGMAAKVGQNLGMANRLTFRNGVDGLTKMVALSEKLGFNVTEIENVANKFMDIQDAIENSAKLSMLGGAAGAFGGNPLDMSYEANYDPEALAERFTKALGGHAYFDVDKLSSKMNAMSRDVVKGIADAMGVSVDTAIGIAKKQAEIRYKNDTFSRDIDKYATVNGKLDETRRDFLLNRTQMRKNEKTGKIELTLNGHTMDYYEKGRGKEEFEEMMRFQNMTDEEIVREQATAVISIKDILNGYVTSIMGTIAEKIAPHMGDIKDFIGDIYRIIKPHIRDIADNIKGLLATFFTKENLDKVKDGISTIAHAVMSVANFLTSSWKVLIAGVLLSPLLGMIGWGVNQLSMVMGANNVGRGPGASGRAGGGAASPTVWSKYSNLRNVQGVGRFEAYKRATSWGWRNSRALRNTVKGGGLLTAALAGYELYNAQENYAERRKAIEADTMLSESEKKKAIEEAGKERATEFWKTGGSAVGTIIGGAIGTLGGPIGIAVGGAVGNWLGGLTGKLIGGAIHGKPEYPKGSVVIPESNATGMKIDEGKGAIPKNHIPQGDNALTWYNADTEGVYRKDYLASTIIESKPVGAKEYIYIPQNTFAMNTGNNTVTVNDINVKFSGSLRLDGGSAYRNIDIKELLNDPIVIAFIAEKLRGALNSNVYMKEMHDTKFNMGYSEPSTIAGHMRNI